MSKTSNFQLDYLDPYQFTVQDVNMDQRRFTTIDNNLYALFKIFGNGIIVTDATSFPLYVQIGTGASITKQIVVSAGRAFVNYNSINYTTPTTLTLPTSSTGATQQKYYLYLKSNSTTSSTETGDFFFTTSIQPISDSYIGLGSILIDYVHNTGVFYDDTANGRQILNIKKLFLSFINNHEHTGGLGNPKKIDIQNETVGHLTSDNILYVDSSKIQGGNISKFVSPQVDHNNLINSGNLSHSQIDSALLSYRDHLNLEIVSSVNNLKVIARLIRTTTETTTPPSFPSGPIATIDRGMNNIFTYVPNVSNDSLVVGYSVSTGSSFYNIGSGCSGPYYITTPASKQANVDRTNHQIVLQTGAAYTGSIQKVFTLQNINPYNKLQQNGLSGYFYGFVPGLDKNSTYGDAHLIHNLPDPLSTSGTVLENYSQYTLTNPEIFNSVGPSGLQGVQISALLTNLISFYPNRIFNFNNNNFYLLHTGSSTPNIVSSYVNGFFDSFVPQPFFASFTGPATGSSAFYAESISTGPRALLFYDSECIANISGTQYTFIANSNGKFYNSNGKIILISYSSTTINIYELGPIGLIQTTNVSSGTNISAAALSYYNSPSDYRMFYMDNNRLYLSTNLGTTQLGNFSGVQDIQIKNGKIFILTNSSGLSSVYYAQESGFPQTFNLININTLGSSITMDIIQSMNSGDQFILTLSNNKIQVFNLNGKEVYRYIDGTSAGSNDPNVTSVYAAFDLGDGTVDLKY